MFFQYSKPICQLSAFLFLILIVPSMPKAIHPTSSSTPTASFNFTAWRQYFEHSLRHVLRPATPLRPLWKEPCRRQLVRQVRSAALTKAVQRNVYADKMELSTSQLLPVLLQLRSWTNSSRLSASVRRFFQGVPLSGVVLSSFESERNARLSPRLALELDGSLGRLVIYMQLFRQHLQLSHAPPDTAAKAQRAERILLSLLCHLQHFTRLRFHRQLEWPSSNFTAADVVPPMWRNAAGTVQMLSHLRNFMLCKEALSFIERFQRVLRAERRLAMTTPAPQ